MAPSGPVRRCYLRLAWKVASTGTARRQRGGANRGIPGGLPLVQCRGAAETYLQLAHTTRAALVSHTHFAEDDSIDVEQRATHRRGRAPGKRARQEVPLETLGAVSLRAAVGYGAGGLQSVWDSLGLLLARPGALPRLPLG